MGSWFPCRLSSLSNSVLHCDLREGEVSPEPHMVRAAVYVGSISEIDLFQYQSCTQLLLRIQTFDGRERGGNKREQSFCTGEQITAEQDCAVTNLRKFQNIMI